MGKGSDALADTLRIHNGTLRCTPGVHPLEDLLARHTVLSDDEVGLLYVSHSSVNS